jgi:hypothetical protein
MYEMTREGFTFLVMGFTGSEAAKRKEAFIQRFNEMETALQQGIANGPVHQGPQLEQVTMNKLEVENLKLRLELSELKLAQATAPKPVDIVSQPAMPIHTKQSDYVEETEFIFTDDLLQQPKTGLYQVPLPFAYPKRKTSHPVKWLRKDIKQLLEYRTQGKTLPEIAKLMGRTFRSVDSKMRDMRRDAKIIVKPAPTAHVKPVSRSRRQYKRWTAAEDAELVAYHQENIGGAEIAEAMGRTPNSIYSRLYDLKLTGKITG